MGKTNRRLIKEKVMNPEELKAIIEMLGNLGQNTMSGFIAYLVFKCIAVFVAYGVGTLCIILAYKLGKYGIEAGINTVYAARVVINLRRELGMRTYGALVHSEIDEFETKVQDIINKSK